MSSDKKFPTLLVAGAAAAVAGLTVAAKIIKDKIEKAAEAEEYKQFTVCVFCGSRTGNGDAFVEAAEKLGEEIVKNDYALVYGGGSIGLMGALANAVNDVGGKVTGIIPYALAPREISGNHLHIGEVILVPTMHKRKALMASKSHAFIALPGGLGTMEELAEMLTWSQLGIHRKAVGLLNINGFYDPYIKMVDNMIEQGFTDAKWRDMIVVSDDPAELLQKLAVHHVPESEISGWMSIKSS